MVQRLFLGVKGHSLLAWYSLDDQRIKQATLELWVHHPRLPDDTRAALITTTRAIQEIFATLNTCDCMVGICRGMAEVMEAIGNRAPQASAK